jgi:hypothetical protein
MFKHRLFWADGSEAGEAAYALQINAGDLIWIPQPNRQLRVLDVVQVDEEDSPYRGLLKVEAA